MYIALSVLILHNKHNVEHVILNNNEVELYPCLFTLAQMQRIIVTFIDSDVLRAQRTKICLNKKVFSSGKRLRARAKVNPHLWQERSLVLTLARK